jgi:hypothetical protein
MGTVLSLRWGCAPGAQPFARAAARFRPGVATGSVFAMAPAATTTLDRLPLSGRSR